MTKLYIPLLAVALVGSSVSAQQSRDVRSASQKTTQTTVRAAQPRPPAANRETIWSDDFSNPSNWVASSMMTDEMTSVDADTWVIGTEGPSPPFAIDTILSSTASNGFAMFDSDLACGGQQNAILTLANPVDLSGYSGVLLRFEQYTARWRGDFYIGVSTDLGATWVDTEVLVDIPVTSSTSPNTMTNPDIQEINLSAVAGGFSEVLIRFRYYSSVDVHADDAGCDYAWQIDDVSFTTLPDNEIQLNYGYTSTIGNSQDSGMEYGRIPQDQFGTSLFVGGDVFNFGGMDQTNVNLAVELSGGQTLELPIGTLASQETSLAEGSIDFPTQPAVGDYTATFTVTSDQIALDGNLDDNTAARWFEVTSDIFSLDKIGGYPEGVESLEQNGTASFADNTENVKLMTMYTLRAPYNVTGLEIGLGPASDPGGQIVISMLDTGLVLQTPPITNQPYQGLESDPYTLTAADVAAGVVRIPFPSAFNLPAGTYFACAAITQIDGNDVFILDDVTVPQPSVGSVLWLPFDPDNQFLYGGNGTAYAIRLTNSESFSSVSEQNVLEGVTMYPNPTNGLVRVNTVGNEKMTLEVMNILGELVSTTTFVGNTVVDLESLSDGVYSVRVSNGVKTAVQRITLQ